MKKRCSWCNENNPVYVKYHDEEWGVPTFDDHVLLEFLILEPFQAGLSWEIILNKREAFREAFANYDRNQICEFGNNEIAQMMNNAKIVRNRRKIEAAINNTRIFGEIQKEWGAFSDYIWHFTDRKVIYETGKTSSFLSDQVAKDFKRRGMKFIGTTTAYSYLQAIGVIYSHEATCDLRK